MESAAVLRSFHYSIGNSHLKSTLDMPGVVPMNASSLTFCGKLSCSRNKHKRSPFVSPPMESAAVLRSFHYSVGKSHLKSTLDMPGVVPMNASSLTFGGKLSCLRNKHKRLVIASAESSESTGTAKYNAFRDLLASFEPPEVDLGEMTYEEEEEEEIYEEENKIYEEDDDKEITYLQRLETYQRKTGLSEAVQTGVGQINGIPVAIACMDFDFIGGSMGYVVGEKITRLIEHAANKRLPLIICCASGGARMQEGSLSLIQMAKISSALHEYRMNKRLLYVTILTSPTTGGVTASFGMLGDIIIAEPNATIAFAGKRVIEETLNIQVPDGLQETDYLFEHGAFDLVVPRTLAKTTLTELFKLHGFFPLNQNQIK